MGELFRHATLRLLVTLSLAAAGAVAGAAVAATIVVVRALWASGMETLPVTGALRAPALVGAAAGAALVPLAAWTLLRAAPFGRSVLETALGTIAGVLFGLTLSVDDATIFAPLGFLAAAVNLNLRYPTWAHRERRKLRRRGSRAPAA